MKVSNIQLLLSLSTENIFSIYSLYYCREYYNKHFKLCFLTNTFVPYPNCWETKQSNLSTKLYKTKTYIKKNKQIKLRKVIYFIP